MDTHYVEFFIPLLMGMEVTGKDEPPLLENMSYGTGHLRFLGDTVARLSGKAALVTNADTGEVVPIIDDISSLMLEVEGGDFWVLPYRIRQVGQSGLSV